MSVSHHYFPLFVLKEVLTLLQSTEQLFLTHPLSLSLTKAETQPGDLRTPGVSDDVWVQAEKGSLSFGLNECVMHTPHASNALWLLASFTKATIVT